MKTWSIGLLALAAAAVWPGSALAQDAAPQAPPADRPMKQERRMDRQDFLMRMLDNPRVMNALALTEEQKAQIKGKSAAHQAAMKPVRADLEKAGMEQARLITGDATDMRQLMDAVEKTGKIRTEMAKLQMKHLVEMRAILTADQRSKLREIMHRPHDHRGEAPRND